MTKFSKKYGKQEFIDNFLDVTPIDLQAIATLTKMPILIDNKKSNYVLNIIATSQDGFNYDFAVNYYSVDNMEFLLPYKIFNSPSEAVKYAHDEMIKITGDLAQQVLRGLTVNGS